MKAVRWIYAASLLIFLCLLSSLLLACRITERLRVTSSRRVSRRLWGSHPLKRVPLFPGPGPKLQPETGLQLSATPREMDNSKRTVVVTGLSSFFPVVTSAVWLWWRRTAGRSVGKVVTAAPTLMAPGCYVSYPLRASLWKRCFLTL